MTEERRESKVVSLSEYREYSEEATDWIERDGGRLWGAFGNCKGGGIPVLAPAPVAVAVAAAPPLAGPIV